MSVCILKKCDNKETVSLYFIKTSAFIPILSLGTSFFSYCLQIHILNLTIYLKFAYADSRHRICLHECILYRLFTRTHYMTFQSTQKLETVSLLWSGRKLEFCETSGLKLPALKTIWKKCIMSSAREFTNEWLLLDCSVYKHLRWSQCKDSSIKLWTVGIQFRCPHSHQIRSGSVTYPMCTWGSFLKIQQLEH